MIISHGVASPTLPQHKVFINFRGEDVRNNFVAHLDSTLKSAGINAFIDGDDGVGRDINDLFRRIEESRIALAVFSIRYTRSKWCLNELVKIKECADRGKLVVIPIFYKVEPYTVKGLKGDFGEQFWELVRSHLDEAQKWKAALESVPSKRGVTYDGKSNERSFIHRISENVKEVLFRISKEAEVPRVTGSQEQRPPMNISTGNKEKPETCLMLMEQIHSRRIFSNRNNLEQAVKDKIACYAQTECQDFGSEALLCTCFPGHEVPPWFDHKADGSELKPKLPPHWCDRRLSGIALCAVVSFKDNRDQNSRILVKCTCEFKTEDGSRINLSWNIGDLTEPDKIEPENVFIGYTSRSYITKRLEEEQGSSGSILTEALLEFQVTDGTTDVGRYCEVVKCGFSLVYAEPKINVSAEPNSEVGPSESISDCVMLYARDLAIEHSQNEKNWTWLSVEETPNGTIVEIAKLIQVHWLEITGTYDTWDLTHGTTYEVVFLVMLEKSASGWGTPINVKLTLPTGQNYEREVNLRAHTRCQWLEIPAGEFVMSPENSEEIEFSMYDHDTDKPGKKGLLVKGVAIRPKSDILF